MDKTTRERLAVLAQLAGAKKEADLGRLAALSGQLETRLAARRDIEAALAREVALAAEAPDVPVLRALDAHVIFADRTLAALDADIARVTAARETQRVVCVRSFGKAQVLGRLGDVAKVRAG